MCQLGAEHLLASHHGSSSSSRNTSLILLVPQHLRLSCNSRAHLG